MKAATSFFKKLIIICTALIIIDFGAGKLLQHYYFTIKSGEQARTTFAMDSTNADILIVGSSRASHHYIPLFFSEKLNLSCYNAGKDKQGIFYNLAIIKAVLKRHRPKYIFLDITPWVFAAKESSLDVLSVLLPYYHQHPEIRETINKRSYWEPVKTKSLLYCYNSLLLQIIFNTIRNGKNDGSQNGYVPIQGVMNADLGAEKYYSQAMFIDSSGINSFNEIKKLSEENNCRLITVISPLYFPVPDSIPSIKIAKDICRENNIPFFDYSRSPQFLANPSLFQDKFHLNNDGAVLFSGIFSKDISRYIKQNKLQ
jgi:hypothetical protein